MAEALHRARCVLHPRREAAGRCVSCERFYCRECVTRHGGRLKCARCLERAASTESSDARGRWSGVALASRLIAGFLAAWLFFLVASEMLLAIPKEGVDETSPGVQAADE